MAKTLHQAASLVILFLGCLAGEAQVPAGEPQVSIIPRSHPDAKIPHEGVPEVHLRVEASLVLIPVQAMSSIGTSITDLIENNFRLFEDGVEQNITHFSKDDAPLSVGLVFDASGSMSNKIHKSAEAAAAFFKTANPGDEFFLVEFGDRPKLSMPFTTDSDQIYRKLVRTRPFGRTSLIDAIHLALVQMKNARNSRRAIVILSDGGDNRSRLTAREIKVALLESNVQMYAMGIFDREELVKHSREEQNGPRLLDELVVQTGGRLYSVDNLDDLESVSRTLGNVLRNQYLLGYTPSNQSRDGKYRHVKVNLVVSADSPASSVSYRRGYYAPAQ